MGAPIPATAGDIGGGPLPVTASADVLAILPTFLKPTDPAPVRDGLVAALTAMILTYQDRAGYAALQSTVLTATGPYLAGLAKDHGILPGVNETDASIRARIINTPSLVTPTAILAAATAILAPYSAILPQYCESSLDRWFVRNRANVLPAGAVDFNSFVFAKAKNASPRYYDRLYPDDSVANGGSVRPQSNPGGARVWADTAGRFFMLRIPDLSPLDGTTVSSYAEPILPSGVIPANPWFVGAGTSTTNTSYIRKAGTTANAVYQAIANTVDRIRGASIRWTLYVDPKLTS